MDSAIEGLYRRGPVANRTDPQLVILVEDVGDYLITDEELKELQHESDRLTEESGQLGTPGAFPPVVVPETFGSETNRPPMQLKTNLLVRSGAQ